MHICSIAARDSAAAARLVAADSDVEFCDATQTASSARALRFDWRIPPEPADVRVQLQLGNRYRHFERTGRTAFPVPAPQAIAAVSVPETTRLRIRVHRLREAAETEGGEFGEREQMAPMGNQERSGPHASREVGGRGVARELPASDSPSAAPETGSRHSTALRSADQHAIAIASAHASIPTARRGAH